jgi:hypothetical protein
MSNNKHAFIIEAPGKSDSIRNLLDTIRYPVPFSVYATCGKLLELPERDTALNENLLPERWEPCRPELFSKLKQALAQYEHVFLMTDHDQEGEFIAWQCLKVLPITSWSRLKLEAINGTAMINALNNQSSHLDDTKIRSVFTRRGLDRYLGYVLSPELDSGRRIPMGTVISPLCKIIDQGDFHIGTLSHTIPSGHSDTHFRLDIQVPRQHYGTARRVMELLKSERLTEYSEDVIENNPSLLTGGEALIALSKRFNKPVKDIFNEMQAAYEQGFISYFRTDSRRISPESIQYTREVAYASKCKLNPDMIHKSISSHDEIQNSRLIQDAHEAVHITKHIDTLLPERYLGMSERIARAIYEITIHELSQPSESRTRDYRKSLNPEVKTLLHKMGVQPIWVERCGRALSNDVRFELMQDDQMMIKAMMDHQIARPSSFVNHAVKMLSNLWNTEEKTLNQRGVQSLATAKHLCPALLNIPLIHNLKAIIDDHDQSFTHSSEIMDRVIDLLQLPVKKSGKDKPAITQSTEKTQEPKGRVVTHDKKATSNDVAYKHSTVHNPEI